jgi:hypothetical protein
MIEMLLQHNPGAWKQASTLMQALEQKKHLVFNSPCSLHVAFLQDLGLQLLKCSTDIKVTGVSGVFK